MPVQPHDPGIKNPKRALGWGMARVRGELTSWPVPWSRRQRILDACGTWLWDAVSTGSEWTLESWSSAVRGVIGRLREAEEIGGTPQRAHAFVRWAVAGAVREAHEMLASKPSSPPDLRALEEQAARGCGEGSAERPATAEEVAAALADLRKGWRGLMSSRLDGGGACYGRTEARAPGALPGTGIRERLRLRAPLDRPGSSSCTRGPFLPTSP